MRIQEDIIFDDTQGVSRQDNHFTEPLLSEDTAFLPLLVDVCRKMLSHNASIKAGTTSLLLDDMLWSPMNQHELMGFINASTDQLSSLLELFSLAMRAEANMIQLQKDANSLEEILIHVNRQLNSKCPDFNLSIDLPMESSLANVDFEYLALTLVYLIEVLIDACKIDQLTLSATEKEDQWQVTISGLTADAVDLLSSMFDKKASVKESASVGSVRSEILLRLRFIQEVLSLQKIEVILLGQPAEVKAIRLNIPVFP